MANSLQKDNPRIIDTRNWIIQETRINCIFAGTKARGAWWKPCWEYTRNLIWIMPT